MAKKIKQEDIIKEFNCDKKTSRKTVSRLIKEGSFLLKFQYVLHIIYKIILNLTIIAYIISIPIVAFNLISTESEWFLMLLCYLFIPLLVYLPIHIILLIIRKIFRFNDELYVILHPKKERILITRDKIGITDYAGMFMIAFSEIKDIEYNDDLLKIYAPYNYVGKKAVRDRSYPTERIYKIVDYKFRVTEKDEPTPSISIYNHYASFNEIIQEIENRRRK